MDSRCRSSSRGGTGRSASCWGSPPRSWRRCLRFPLLLFPSDMLLGLSADRRAYTTRWAVRTYELDVNGHVNNSVYLNYAEQIATEHAEAVGFGREWNTGQGG